MRRLPPTYQRVPPWKGKLMTERLNYWRLLAQEHEREVQEATREADIPRALREAFNMAHALENARISEARGE